MLIMPSLLAAPSLELLQAIETLIEDGFSTFHIDMMDYHYTQNFGLTPKNCEDILKHFPNVKLDVHLMTNPTPLHLIERLLEMGIQDISIHPNTMDNPSDELRIALSPNETLQSNHHKLLFLTVNPGFSHQKMQKDILAKAKKAKEDGLNILIDGGINLENLDEVLSTNPDGIVIGGALFQKDRNLLLQRIKDLLS